MQVFARRGFVLRAASLETRIAYTVFLGLAFLGIASMGALGIGRIGVTPSAIATYYRGGESEMSFPKQFWQLAEVSHFHLFSISVVLLILSHLLSATGLSARARYGVIGATSAGAFLDIGAPWAIRYGSPGFAYALLAAWLLLGVGMLSMVAVSLASMWGPERWSLGQATPERAPAAEGT